MNNLAQQAAFGNPNHGLSNSLGAQCIPAGSPGVTDMTSKAHAALEGLQSALAELYGKAQPLIEPFPEPGCAVGQDKSCEAPAVAGLRYLVERIHDKTEEIRRFTSALRV